VNNVHDIIKAERKKRGIPTMYWSREMARLAQSQADYCAKVGRMVHSNRYAFKGGENICSGEGNLSPRTIVNTWLKSKAGHREYIISPRVTKAGVGIAKRNGKVFVAWAFSDEPPSYPDCPYYKSRFTSKAKPIKLPNPFKIFLGKQLKTTKPFKIGLSLVFGFGGLLGMALGAHGVYVYFNRLDIILGGGGAKLFLAIDVPMSLRDLVMWASARGLQSWIIPTLIFLAGLWVFHYSRLWDIVSRFLAKVRP